MGDPGSADLLSSLMTHLAALGGGGGVVGLVVRSVLGKATDELRKEIITKIESNLDGLKKELTERFEKLEREMDRRDERSERKSDELVGKLSVLQSSYAALHARMEQYDGSRGRRKSGG